MGQHDDEDGDGIADRGRVIPPDLLDRQSQAFRSNAATVPDDLLHAQAEAVHAPLGTSATAVPLRLPEDYEAEQWDAGRDGPKSLDEARVALAARIADPDAPDGDEVRGAYDEEGSPNSRSSGHGTVTGGDA